MPCASRGCGAPRRRRSSRPAAPSSPTAGWLSASSALLAQLASPGARCRAGSGRDGRPRGRSRRPGRSRRARRTSGRARRRRRGRDRPCGRPGSRTARSPSPAMPQAEFDPAVEQHQRAAAGSVCPACRKMSVQASSVCASTAETNCGALVVAGRPAGAAPPRARARRRSGSAAQDDRRVDAQEHRDQGDGHDAEPADAADPAPRARARRRHAATILDVLAAATHLPAHGAIPVCGAVLAPDSSAIAARMRTGTGSAVQQPGVQRAAAPRRRRHRSPGGARDGRRSSRDRAPRPAPARRKARRASSRSVNSPAARPPSRAAPRQVVSGRSRTAIGAP